MKHFPFNLLVGSQNLLTAPYIIYVLYTIQYCKWISKNYNFDKYEVVSYTGIRNLTTQSQICHVCAVYCTLLYFNNAKIPKKTYYE